MGPRASTRNRRRKVHHGAYLNVKDRKPLAILVLGFNRPDSLSLSLGALSQVALGHAAHFFLALDGSRGPNDKGDVKRCQALFDRFSERQEHVTKLYATSHHGLRDHVVRSVTKALQTNHRIVVLEDDCILGPTSLDFFKWGLDRMEEHISVGAVSGTYFGPGIPDLAFEAARFNSWGWATNNRTWARFVDSSFLQTPLTKLGPDMTRLAKRSPLPYKYEYLRIKRRLRELNSWAIPFDLFLREHGLTTIKPTMNQVKNIGFASDATHTFRGHSLSLSTSDLAVERISLSEASQAKRIEGLEAWTKFSRLSRELLGF